MGQCPQARVLSARRGRVIPVGRDILVFVRFLTILRDMPDLHLSRSQREIFAGWRRPQELLSLNSGDADNVPRPVMFVSKKTDIVQDLLTDCSVVASLCATTSRLERGLDKVQFPFCPSSHCYHSLTNECSGLPQCHIPMATNMEILRNHPLGNTYSASTSMDASET